MLSEYLILPLIAGGVAQLAKFFIKSNNARWSWRSLIAYSGMPSSHAAITVCLATVIGLAAGLNHPAFAIAVIYAIITIRDAVGLRRQVGRQGAMINEITKELDEEKLLNEKYPHLLEKVGHTPAQLAVGSLLGLFVGIIGYLIINL